jgi:putative glycosyltransferase (TIGR04372 family)
MIIDRIFHKINSSKSHPYFYLSPHVYSFGNCADNIHAGLMRAKHEKKKLVILYPFDIPFIFKYKLINIALFNIKSDFIVDQGRYTLVLSRTLMTIIYMPLRVTGLLLRKFSRFNLFDSYHFPQIGIQDIYAPGKSFNKFSFKPIQKYNLIEDISRKIDFTLSLKGNVSDGYEQEKLGIPKNSWFVCLHVRESGFHGDKPESLSSKLNRNPNILNYISAIKEITSKGGWVVRMGDNSMKPLPNMENVIDYPFTKYKSEFMDLCLIKNCRFFIGGQSGLQIFAELASKNILHINMYWPTGPTTAGPTERGIIQHVYSKRDKRYLSIKELLTLDLEEKNYNMLYGLSDENYAQIENSEEEISNAVVEYMNYLSNDDMSLTSKQKEFNAYRNQQGYRLLKHNRCRLTSPKTHSEEDEMIELYKVLMKLEEVKGTLSADFLEKHW